MEKDYLLVVVGNAQVGLIGLKEIFEELKGEKERSEPELKAMLVARAERKNYITPSVRPEYEKALFREFKKFLGEKVEGEKPGHLEVVIMGVGCSSCNKLEQDVISVLSESGIQASLNHISDPSLMAQHRILLTPALIINGKVKSTGRIPSKPMIKKWLEEEQR